MTHGLSEQRFHSYEDTKKWVDSWIASKDMSFFRRGIHLLSEREIGKRCEKVKDEKK